MDSLSSNDSPSIPFQSLRANLKNRSPEETGSVPVTSQDISAKSAYYGQHVSVGSINRFLRGESNPDGPTFPVIVSTIEGLAHITIDFKDSPYKNSTAEAGRGREPR